MKTYDYLENVKEDVRNYIEENKIVVTSSNREEVEQELNDTLFVNDSVTGNASGSYTFSTWQEAKKHIWLAYTPKECIKELTDTCIVGWKDGEVHSLTAIRVNKNGKVSYGRTVKY